MLTFQSAEGTDGDGTANFKTVLLAAKHFSVQLHLTLPYCPWSSGAVDGFRPKLLHAPRATFSELQNDRPKWPDIITSLQLGLDNCLSLQQGNKCPITAFMDREPTPLSGRSSELQLSSQPQFANVNSCPHSTWKDPGSSVLTCIPTYRSTKTGPALNNVYQHPVVSFGNPTMVSL